MSEFVTRKLSELTLEQFGNSGLDYPGYSTGYEIDALWSYLDVLEEQIQHAQAQYRLRSERALHRGRNEYDDHEYLQKLDELERVADSHIPRFFRNGAIIPIWGLFELAISDFGRYAIDKGAAGRAFRDFEPKRPFSCRAYRYFNKELTIPLVWSTVQRDQLDDLAQFRHRIAHENGRFESLTADKAGKFKLLVQRVAGVEIEHESLVVSTEYVLQSASLVTELINVVHQEFVKRYLRA